MFFNYFNTVREKIIRFGGWLAVGIREFRTKTVPVHNEREQAK